MIERAGWYDAIGNIGGMQGFIAMCIGIVLGGVTEIDFITEMVKGLYLKRQPTQDYLEKYTMRGKKIS